MSPDGKRIMIFLSEPAYRSSILALLDAETYELAGSYLGVQAWIPAREMMLLRPFAWSMYLSPYYTMEDLVELGETILKTGLPQ